MNSDLKIKENRTMKRLSLYLLVSVLGVFGVSGISGVSSAFAQVDRTKYPEPGPAPQINIGDPATFTLPNGLKVFVVENHKLPRVTYSLVLDRDPLLEGDKAGLTGLVGQVLMGGTHKMSKDELDEAVDQIGARLNVSATSASASSLKKHNERLLELFSDVLFNSSFSEAELDKAKKQTLSGLAAAKDDPSTILSVVSNAVMYGKDHPYGENATEQTVENIQIQDIHQYYDTYFRPNIGYLAIVGDISVAEAKTLVNKYFANWESREVPKHEWHTPAAPKGNQVIIVNRSSSKQSALELGYLVDLKPNNPDALAVAVISRVLGGGSSGRLFQNLREDKSYTYGAYGSISSGRLTGSLSASADVGTGVTDSATHEFLYELDRLAKSTITQDELDLAKAAMAGSFGRSLEQPSTIASFAINTEIQNLPKDHYKNYLKRLDALTLDQVNALAAKYVRPDHLYITAVGNADGFAEKMQRFGDISYYTVTGDPEVKVEITDASLTPEVVISKYLAAIGGADKLRGVKSLKSISEAEIQGMTLTLEQFVDQDQAVAIQNSKIAGQVLSQVRVAGGKVTVSAQGQSQELPAEAAEVYLGLLDIFPELYYFEKNYSLELDGISQVNGEDAYKLKVTAPSGMTSVEYFSVASGLKLKSESDMAGEITNGKFVDFGGGILFPDSSTIVNQMVPFPIKAVVKSIEINSGLTAEDLK